MSCVIHFVGDDARIEELATLVPVADFEVFRKGEARSNRPSAIKHRTSGIRFRASDADFDDLELQQAQTLAFLQSHSQALAAMRQVTGVERAGADFGISMLNVIVQSDTFRVGLLLQLARLGLTLTLSQYPTEGRNKKLKQYRREL